MVQNVGVLEFAPRTPARKRWVSWKFWPGLISVLCRAGVVLDLAWGLSGLFSEPAGEVRTVDETMVGGELFEWDIGGGEGADQFGGEGLVAAMTGRGAEKSLEETVDLGATQPGLSGPALDWQWSGPGCIA